MSPFYKVVDRKTTKTGTVYFIESYSYPKEQLPPGANPESYVRLDNSFCVYQPPRLPLKRYLEDGTQPCEEVIRQILQYNDWIAAKDEREKIAVQIAAMKAELTEQESNLS